MVLINLIFSLLLFMNELCQIIASKVNQCETVSLNEPRIALVGDSMGDLDEEGKHMRNMITKDPLVRFHYPIFHFFKLIN